MTTTPRRYGRLSAHQRVENQALWQVICYPSTDWGLLCGGWSRYTGQWDVTVGQRRDDPPTSPSSSSLASQPWQERRWHDVTKGCSHHLLRTDRQTDFRVGWAVPYIVVSNITYHTHNSDKIIYRWCSMHIWCDLRQSSSFETNSLSVKALIFQCVLCLYKWTHNNRKCKANHGQIWWKIQVPIIYEMLTQCWFNSEPASQPVVQY